MHRSANIWSAIATRQIRDLALITPPANVRCIVPHLRTQEQAATWLGPGLVPLTRFACARRRDDASGAGNEQQEREFLAT